MFPDNILLSMTLGRELNSLTLHKDVGSAFQNAVLSLLSATPQGAVLA